MMKPKYYIKFLENDLAQTGSDSVFILDGRNSLDTMINDGHDRMKALKRVKGHYNAFEVRHGTFNSYRTIAKIRTV